MIDVQIWGLFPTGWTEKSRIKRCRRRHDALPSLGSAATDLPEGWLLITLSAISMSIELDQITNRHQFTPLGISIQPKRRWTLVLGCYRISRVARAAVGTHKDHGPVSAEVNTRFLADILSAFGTPLLLDPIEDATQAQVLV